MRLVFAALANLIRLFFLVLSWPFRLLAQRRRPWYVRFRLEEDPPYRKLKGRSLRLWRRKPEPASVTSIAELKWRLELLARDPRVKGALFELEGLSVSPAKRVAIAELIAAFRAKGKQAVGFCTSASNSEYALLCAMDRILLPSAGRIELTGYAAEPMAAGAALRRLGIGAQFVRRGEHKTAPELFTNDNVSPIVRETIEVLLDERYQDLVATLAKGRSLSEADARGRIDAGPYSAKRALSSGLCDALVGEADLAEFLAKGAQAEPPKEKDGKEKKKAKGGEHAWKIGTFDDYVATLLWPPIWRRFRRLPRLSLVKIEGMIVPGEGGGSLAKLAGSKAVVKALRAAARHRRSKAVLVYVNSGGGAATASELMLEEVRRLAKKKKVVAYFDQVAASGGYMVLLGAHEIWAGPMSLAGSIGVFAGKFEVSTLMDRAGIAREVITRGRNAGLQSVSRPFTDGERKALEDEVDEIYEAFLEMAASARKMTRDEVHRRGEGRVYSGRRAVEAGLVDRTGGFEEACRRALQLAGVEGEQFEIAVHSAAPRGLPLSSLFQQLGGTHLLALWWPGWRFPG